jgi:hypothetical protein
MPIVIASLVAAAVVLVSPFMGQLQGFLRRSLTTRQYVLLFGGAVIVAVALALLMAFTRIRDRRAQRFGLLAIAVVFGGGYMWVTATPWAEVNAVERVHFIEYGLIAFLFYRAWRPAGDLSTLVLPMLVAFMVGTLDEWLQWFIPYRVGEAHDVFLNLASIGCGLMFAYALSPPPVMRWRLEPESARRFGLISAGVFLVFAAFVSQVHLGHLVPLENGAAFRSHYSPGELQALQLDRASRWRTHPPVGIARLSREDQYLDEALWHVRRRNNGEPFEAWHENLILEQFFAPVLDLPTYATPDGARWPAGQRANVLAAQPARSGSFLSAAEPYPIVPFSKPLFWTIAIALTLMLAGLPFAFARRALRTDPSRSDRPAR